MLKTNKFFLTWLMTRGNVPWGKGVLALFFTGGFLFLLQFLSFLNFIHGSLSLGRGVVLKIKLHRGKFLLSFLVNKNRGEVKKQGDKDK